MPNNTFSTAGTFNWTCPNGVTSVDVEVWGGGGGGASTSLTTAAGGGSGNNTAGLKNGGTGAPGQIIITWADVHVTVASFAG